MKQMQHDRHVIAWFKIAEYVSRGEKERALGVYRLLSHSFNDDAIARQLEGDIYHSFDEKEQAIILYRQAAELYYKSRRFLEAAAIGEHLVSICPSDSNLRRHVIQMYISLAMISKIKAHMPILVDLFAQQRHWHEIKNVIEDCVPFFNDNECVEICSDVIINAHKLNCPWDTLSHVIKYVLDNLYRANDKKSIQSFLSLLQSHSDELHRYALDSIKSDVDHKVH